jgi:hypothetical protein
MVFGKTEIKATAKESDPSKARKKKKRLKRRYWLLIDLIVLVVFLTLLLYKPDYYKPVLTANDDKVSKYLTHALMPQIYNGADSGKPFDVVILQDGIKDIIAHSEWPIYSSQAIISAPDVKITENGIFTVTKVTFSNVDFIVTIVLEPALDEEGLLNLNVTKVKVGAMNITPLVSIAGKKMYDQRLESVPVDMEDIRTKIAASIFTSEPFDPVFEVKDIFDDHNRQVRIQKITFQDEKLILGIVPVDSTETR